MTKPLEQYFFFSFHFYSNCYGWKYSAENRKLFLQIVSERACGTVFKIWDLSKCMLINSKLIPLIQIFICLKGLLQPLFLLQNNKPESQCTAKMEGVGKEIRDLQAKFWKFMLWILLLPSINTAPNNKKIK